ncbi:methyltransferase family protein [Candidatus Zixiibacteriota bacterium]
MDLKRLAFKQRGVTPVPLVVVIILFANPVPASMYPGFALVIFGEIIRLWAVSHAGGATRTRRVGARSLVTTGPYARTRNPLYVGNIFIYLGFAWVANIGLPWFALLVLGFFGFQYYLIILLEEEKLTELFEQEYQHYFESVPRLLPRIRPFPSDSVRKSSLVKALRPEISTLLAIAVTSLIIAGRFWNIW